MPDRWRTSASGQPAVAAAYVEDGFDELQDRSLRSVPLMWSEARSTLHLAAWRGRASAEDARAALTRLESCPIQPVHRDDLGSEAWRIADEMGWARTYDAEYVALAGLLGCRFVTLDVRLRRGTERLGFVVGPDEL